MFQGVNHVGIGVSNMEKSLKFYGDLLGFKQVVFDYTGHIPSLESITGKSDTQARVVMLKNQRTGCVGQGLVKLVQLLPPDKPEKCTVAETTLWGDVGIAEACFNVRPSAKVIFDELLEKGLKATLTPATGTFPPYNTVATYAYMRDPDNGLLEFIDWKEWRGYETEPRVEGLNHVGFGVSDMDTTVEFYRKLGFIELIFDYTGALSNMATMFPPEPPKMKVQMLGNYHGAWIEPIQLLPPYKPSPFKKAWGHLGAMEFAIGVTNLEKAYEELQLKGIKFLCPPQTIEVPSGHWKYAYLDEPDNLYVSLIEPRY